MMTEKFVLKLGACLLLSAMLLSCEQLQNTINGKTSNGIDKKELPKWTVEVNQIIKYPRATPGEKEVPSYKGEFVWIRKHFEINSKLITLITAVPSKEKDKFDLKLKLDKHGSMIAMRLCNESPQPALGLLVDGIYYGKVNVLKATEKEDDYSEILLAGKLDKITANTIAKYSEANYEHLHKNDNK